jgi:hypothetical protein
MACLKAALFLMLPRAPTKVRLQKTLKEGLRRCVYRRWEADVKGTALITKTTDLERMYRGNTPYPIGKARTIVKTFTSSILAKRALCDMVTRRRGHGYRALMG